VLGGKALGDVEGAHRRPGHLGTKDVGGDDKYTAHGRPRLAAVAEGSLTAMVEPTVRKRNGRERGPGPGWPAALLGAVYLTAVLPYSLLTPAWEPNDELAHTAYVEYIVAHGSLPRIALANGVESHQPPLYYLLAAAWQELLRIPAFLPSASAIPGGPRHTSPGAWLTYWHQYTRAQHTNAIYLHELRLLSVGLGLATVLLGYGCARLVLSRPLPAFAAGLAVALFPKLLVVDSAVSNDVLVIALCALALMLFLLSERARQEGDEARRRWLMLALGASLGLAAIAKFNSLPLAVLLLVLATLPAVRHRAMVIDTAIAAGGFVVVSGWWFVRNQVLYGQFLATRATEAYLKSWDAALIEPVSWTDAARFTRFVPSSLYHSVWYDGAANQWLLPNWMDNVLWALAGLSVVSAAGAFATRGRPAALALKGGLLAGLAVAGSVLAGIVAVVLIAQTTTQAEGRIAFIGLVGFAIVLVLGTDAGRSQGRWRAAVLLWPAILVGVNLYVLAKFLLPLGGL
jgi:4-amino-4-deoxy-L-arabinose transferase-like glycosyltransferase